MTSSTKARGTTNGNSRGSSYDRARRRARLVERDGWPEVKIVLCHWCDVPLLQDEDPEAPGQSVTADRLVPGCDGGKYLDDNLVPACGPCNQSRGGELGAMRVPRVTPEARPSTQGANVCLDACTSPAVDPEFVVEFTRWPADH